jgi:heme exporter protein A
LLLLGANGAGKSTFIRVFAGLMPASSGRALILDQPARASRHAVGVVSHTHFLYDELTALENLRLFAELYAVANPYQRCADLLEQVGMAALADVRVGSLSRGQQQRITIARALLHEPSVLLLDEPDTGLDIAAFGLLQRLITREPRATVLTTHNLAAGVQLGTRAAVLAHGRIVHEQPTLAPPDVSMLSDILHQLAAA